MESNDASGSKVTVGTKELVCYAPTLVCFALKEEAANFDTKGVNAEILVTGIGTRNAAEALYPVLEKRSFTMVLTCGFAGALNPELKLGDVLFDEDSELKLAELFRAAGARPGKCHCSKRVAVTATEKAELRRSTGADAVEMESGMIRQICRETKIRSATVRVISDTADEDLPLDFNLLMTPEQAISPVKLGLAIAKSPGSVPRLLELQRRTRFAAQKLAQVLNHLLTSLDSSRIASRNPSSLG